MTHLLSKIYLFKSYNVLVLALVFGSFSVSIPCYAQANSNRNPEITISERSNDSGDDVTISLDGIRKSFQQALKNRNYQEALNISGQIPVDQQNEVEQALIERLNIVVYVDTAENQTASILQSDDELSSKDKESVKRLYRAAQQAFIQGRDDLARDLIIQSIYIDRRNFNAKRFLKYGFGLNTGDYKVEDKKREFWSQSEIFFYGGNYERSLKVLETLTVFEPKNALVHERMGSSYYMLGQKKEAVEAWTTAIFLDPNNEDVKFAIEKTEKMIEEEREIARRERASQKEESKEEDTETEQTETQLLGVFPTQTKAYSYAQKLKEQNLKAIVEQLDNGKWAVKVAKSQIGKKGG